MPSTQRPSPAPSSGPGREQVHGTCVEIDGGAVLLRGASGSGKSDLALRLIDAGARLVADDRVNVALEDGRVMAAAPAEIAGLLEVGGVGIFRVGCVAASPLALVIDLVAADALARLPKPDTWTCLGVALPRIDLAPFHASAPAKVRLAVREARGAIIRIP